MGKLSNREELFPATLELVNNIFNDLNNGIKYQNYTTLSWIKRYSPQTWKYMTDKQKTRLYRTAKKHHKL